MGLGAARLVFWQLDSGEFQEILPLYTTPQWLSSWSGGFGLRVGFPRGTEQKSSREGRREGTDGDPCPTLFQQSRQEPSTTLSAGLGCSSAWRGPQGL